MVFAVAKVSKSVALTAPRYSSSVVRICTSALSSPLWTNYKPISATTTSTSWNENNGSLQVAHSSYFCTRGLSSTSHSLDSAVDANALVAEYSAKRRTAISLMALLKTGRGDFVKSDTCSHTASPEVLIQAADFVRHELSVRFANQINIIDNMGTFSTMPSVKIVREGYLQSFLELVSVKPITTPEEEEQFAPIMKAICDKHSSTLITMAAGAFDFRDAIRKGEVGNFAECTLNDDRDNCVVVQFEEMQDMHDFLDQFYMSMVGTRLLSGQYLALREPYMENHVGMIQSTVSPCDVLQHAIDDATYMCDRKYGVAPEVIVTGRKGLTFPYLPSHLHYILLELIKNSMQATINVHGEDSHPVIKVVIADGKDNEDVVIKVSDEGGGIPRSNMKRIWSYLFTTADIEVQEGMMGLSDKTDHSTDSPLSGLGYGLPISRSYARYFGGDLVIMSMEGYGTDAFVYLNRLGSSKEALPT